MHKKEMPILSETPSASKSSAAAKPAPLPSLTILFRESWLRFQKTWVNLLVLTVISFGLNCGLVLIGLLGTIPLIIGYATQVGSHTLMSPLFFGVLIILTAIFITLLVAGLLIIMSLGHIASTITVVSDGASALGTVLKRSLKLVIPLSVVLLGAQYLILGGFFFFVLPGILFTIMFSFVLVIMIAEDKRGMDALRRSAALVLAHFWGILLRLGILLLIDMGLLYAVPHVLQNVSESFAVMFSVLLPILQIILGWFTLAYTATVYKHAASTSVPDKQIPLRWVFVIATLGWLLLVVALFFLMTALSQFASSGALQKFIEQYYKPKPQTPFELRGDLSHYRMESFEMHDRDLQEM